MKVKKVKVSGGGRLFEGGTYLLFWPRGWVLIRRRARIRAWALIRGNAVYEEEIASSPADGAERSSPERARTPQEVRRGEVSEDRDLGCGDI